MKISELKELEGQNVFFKNPFGQIQEVTVEYILSSARIVRYSFRGQYLTGFAGEFFKTREEAESDN